MFIKGSRCRLQEASTSRDQGDPQVRHSCHGKFIPPYSPPLLPHVIFARANIRNKIGHLRRPPRPPIEQEGVGERYQGVPFRLRVRISRKRNDEEGAKEKLYSYVQAVNVKESEAKGLHTVVVEDS